MRSSSGPSVVDDTEGGQRSQVGAGAADATAPTPRVDRAGRGNRAVQRPRTSDRWWFTLLVAIVYLVVSFLANFDVWVHGITHTVQAGGGDVNEQIWFLAQTPWALVHGHNPFFNNFLNAPNGINLLDNTTMPLLGMLGAPITFLLGPIATWNILLNVALATSALTFYLMARRFVRWRPAAFVAGLVYGFSPFAVAQGAVHLFLVVGALPPLVILFLDRFFRTRSDPPWLTGLVVGGCFVAEFYISSEVFVSMVVLTVIAGAVAGAWWVFRGPGIDVARLAKMGVIAVAVIAVGGGLGAWLALTGPEHVHGPEQPAVAIAGLSSDPVGIVVPTLFERIAFGPTTLGDSLVAQRGADWSIVQPAPWEGGAYVGVPLLVILVVGTIVLWRRRFVRFVAFMAVAGMVLSMGSVLHVDGHLTGVPLPFTVLAHLPLLDSSIASRYVAFFWLFAALLLAMILDAFYLRMVAEDRPSDRFRATLNTSILVCCGLLLLIPAWPYESGPANVPAWFTTQGHSIPVGTTVVVYPFASSVDSSAMLWQAMADMRFRMPGGYAIFPTSEGTATFDSTPSVLAGALGECTSGGGPQHWPQLSPSTIRSELRSWNASMVAVASSARGAACATHLFEGALGAPRRTGGVRLWSYPVPGDRR